MNPLDPVLTIATDVGAKLTEWAFDHSRRLDVSPEIRYQAYKDFRAAAIGAVLAIDLWTEVKPSFIGGYWSFSLAKRAQQQYFSSLQASITTFAEVVCLGNEAIVESAREVTKAVVNLQKELRFPGLTELNRVPSRAEGYQAARDAVFERVRVFMEVTTDDLGRRRNARPVTNA